MIIVNVDTGANRSLLALYSARVCYNCRDPPLGCKQVNKQEVGQTETVMVSVISTPTTRRDNLVVLSPAIHGGGGLTRRDTKTPRYHMAI